MNYRERFLTVINGAIPDRVPVTLFIIEQGHFLRNIAKYQIKISTINAVENFI